MDGEFRETRRANSGRICFRGERVADDLSRGDVVLWELAKDTEGSRGSLRGSGTRQFHIQPTIVSLKMCTPYNSAVPR